MTRPGEYLEGNDVNKDGVSDWEDIQARNRALDQAESARAMRELGATIGQGVRNIGAAFAGLWRNVLAVPLFLKRVRIVARVQIVAQSVGDAQALYDKLFPFPPNDPGQESYRRSFVALALEPNKTRAQWLVFADMLDGLQAFEDRPLDAWLVLRRAPKPALTAPRAEPAAIQGFAGLPSPVGLFTPVTQVLAVLLVLLGLWNFAQRAEIKAAKADAKENELRADAATAANDGLAKRMVAAEEAMQESQIVLADYEKRIAAMRMTDAQRAAEQAAIRRREKERADAIANGDTGRRTDDDWLRELAAPASADGAMPSDPAATAAPGVQPVLPDAAGSDAAGAAPGSER